jgi:ABC-type Fe3+-siderophore transport system permease subunit
MYTYPVIRFFTRYGELVAAAFGLSAVAIAAWIAFAFGFGWGMVIVGIVVGVAVSFLCMVFVELARLIAEMMLPK